MIAVNATPTPTTDPAMPRGWGDAPLQGPADLLVHFAFAAIEDIRGDDLDLLDDEPRILLYNCVEIGCRIALAGMGIPIDWEPVYQKALAAIRKEAK
jgi:hypothetical protein